MPACRFNQAAGGREGPGRGGSKRRGHLVAAIVQRKLDCRGWRLVVTGHSLGAGAAALIAMRLHGRFPGAPPHCARVLAERQCFHGSMLSFGLNLLLVSSSKKISMLGVIKLPSGEHAGWYAL